MKTIKKQALTLRALAEGYAFFIHLPLLLILLALLNSCTTLKFAKHIDKWQGKSEEMVKEKWGVPSGVAEKKKEHLLIYSYEEGKLNKNKVSFGHKNNNWCTVRFIIKKQLVKRVDWDGYNCKEP